jgi:PPK2 family polyphosphate:nucleotide phosphotransferase
MSKLGNTLDLSPFLVKPGKRVKLKDFDPKYSDGFANKDEAKAALDEDKQMLSEAQELLFASGMHSVLIIFQAPDAAGKDGAIKHVMSGINPQGCEVTGFRAPNEEERSHHFMWRPMRFLPGRGRISIFNRSYYEEVLVVRVHPAFLENQYLPPKHQEKLAKGKLDSIWQDRFDDINSFEKHATRNGMCIIKFFLNVSQEEQRQRLLQRLAEPAKHYKFSAADLRERPFWKEYRHATEEMLEKTSTAWAPWYVIPADKKWFTRAAVADVIAQRIRDLKLHLPKTTDKQLAAIKDSRKILEAEKGR